MSKFQFGQLVATPGALHFLAEHGISADTLLARHGAGDWGDLGAEDNALNNAALKSNDDRILSCYKIGPGADDNVWIITEWDRSVTTVLLPSEY